MDHEHLEPNPPALRPCSTPHSAPSSWLRRAASGEEQDEQTAAAHDSPSQALSDQILDDVAAQLLVDPIALAGFIARISPGQERADGWSPFARKLFLQVLAETGRVSTACEYTGLSRQSAYTLRARDRLFAAGWDAASEIARAPLADALYEKALDGVTETVSKDGKVVATRVRFDSRLSTAVLARLDKRCDRAEERGSRHLALVANWDEWLAMVGAGEEDAARALLDGDAAASAQHCQPCQLAAGEDRDDEDVEDDPQDRCWRNEDGVWMTNFPPPPGYDLYEAREYGTFGYQRQCTEDEAELLDANEAAAEEEERTADEELRDCWFDMLRSEMSGGGDALSEEESSEIESANEEISGSGESAADAIVDEAPAGDHLPSELSVPVR